MKPGMTPYLPGQPVPKKGTECRAAHDGKSKRHMRSHRKGCEQAGVRKLPKGGSQGHLSRAQLVLAMEALSELGQLGLTPCVYTDTAPHPLECLPQAQPAGASSVPGALGSPGPLDPCSSWGEVQKVTNLKGGM